MLKLNQILETTKTNQLVKIIDGSKTQIGEAHALYNQLYGTGNIFNDYDIVKLESKDKFLIIHV